MNSAISFLQSLPALALALIEATLLLLVLQLLVKSLPRISAASKHLLLVAGITTFLLLPIFTILLPTWELPVLPVANAAAVLPSDEFHFTTGDGRFSPGTPEVISAARPEKPQPDPVPTAKTDPPMSPSRIRWTSIGIYAWITVALFLFSRLGLGLLRVWWIIRTSDPVTPSTSAAAAHAKASLSLDRPIRLRSSDYVDVPMICGFFNPTVLLPATTAEWPQEQIEAVLLHEFAHLKRWDALTLLLTNLVTSLFWFQPQVWFASLSARRECERACDDLVLGSGAKPSEYAGHLLSVVKLMPDIERFGAVTLGMSQRSQLEGRLLSILHPNLRRGSVQGKWIAIAIVAVALLVAPIAAVRLTASPQVDGGDGSLILKGSAAPVVASEVITVSEKRPRTKKDHEKGAEFFAEAFELHQSGRFDEAIALFERAAQLGYKTDTALFNIACGYAQKRDADRALQYLNQAIDAGFDSFSHLREDSDLDPIRSDARFRALLAKHPGKDHGKKRDRDAGMEARLERLRRDRSSDGEQWLKVGNHFLAKRRLDEAVEALSNASRHLGHRNQSALYNLACAYALRGDGEAAYDTLERAINSGFDQPAHMRKDEDLESLRGTPRFEQLAQLARNLSLDQNGGKEFRDEPQYSRRRWAAAVQHFSDYVRSHPTSGRAWFNLGYALHYSHEHARAIDAFQRALNLGYRTPTAIYNIACAHAMLGQTDAALTWLERSETAGFELAQYIYSDEDLESLHDNPRFENLAQRVGAERDLINELKKKFVVKKKRQV